MNKLVPCAPRPGDSLVFQTPVYVAEDFLEDVSGVVVAGNGCVSVCAVGSGLGVHLDSIALTSLGITLIQLGHTLAVAASGLDSAPSEIMKQDSNDA